MKHLFTPPGEQALAAVLSLQPLLAFDFDGTLAPIVARPDDAKVSAAVAQQLRQLAVLRPVAIVTGRMVADVRPRLGFEPHYIIGNHGAEDPENPLPPLSGVALDGLRQRILMQGQALQDAGVSVEDKGYSLALHYRLARDRELAQVSIQSVLEGIEGDPRLQTFGGKCVMNVVVAGAPDKGDAVLTLVQRTGVQAAVFIGDDLNDEAVFERAPVHWLTVRIGRDDPRSQAKFFLDSHAEVALFLGKMLGPLSAAAAQQPPTGSASH
ncbi:MAG: trehalose-phosphatase [Pseudomonadota bacterium]